MSSGICYNFRIFNWEKITFFISFKLFYIFQTLIAWAINPLNFIKKINFKKITFWLYIFKIFVFFLFSPLLMHDYNKKLLFFSFSDLPLFLVIQLIKSLLIFFLNLSYKNSYQIWCIYIKNSSAIFLQNEKLSSKSVNNYERIFVNYN